MTDVTFSWIDRSTGITHGAIAKDVRLGAAGELAARVAMRCGLRVMVLEGSDVNQRDVDCALCLAADDVGGLTDALEEPAAAREAERELVPPR